VPEEIGPRSPTEKEVVYQHSLPAQPKPSAYHFAADPKHLGRRSAFFARAPHWGRNLLITRNFACRGPGGGLSPRRQAAGSPASAGFLLCPCACCRLFRRLFLEHLRTPSMPANCVSFSGLGNLPDRREFNLLAWPLRGKRMGRLCQETLAAPAGARLRRPATTHRVAISNIRLRISKLASAPPVERYRDKGQQKDHDAFCRGIHPPVSPPRLPNGFQRIRYYGLLGKICSPARETGRCRNYWHGASSRAPAPSGLSGPA